MAQPTVTWKSDVTWCVCSEWRGCPTPDDYADETINRCARKITDGEEIRDVATYCIGVARMLLRDEPRRSLGARSLMKGRNRKARRRNRRTMEKIGLNVCGGASVSSRLRIDLILAYYQG
jgi:hypothetical protein